MNQFMAWLWQGAIVAGVTALVIRWFQGTPHRNAT